MQLLRLADSTELNNACIVGFTVLCALVATWMLVALSIFLIRRAGQLLRIRALRSFIEGYTRKARLAGVVASFAIAISGAATVEAVQSSFDPKPPGESQTRISDT